MSKVVSVVRVAVALLALSLTCFPSHRRHSRAQGGQAGVFDFYLFVLSWSPEFCHSKPGAAQCSAHKGFVVHGLWPQNNNGSYPSNCATNQPGPSNSSAIADIMPAEIIQHEWQTHGTCSGLSGDAYFALIRQTFESIKIPEQFQAPKSSVTLHPKELKQAFESLNGNLSDADIAVQLRGNYLNAAEFCFAKGPSPVPLACAGVRDVTGGTFIVPPVN